MVQDVGGGALCDVCCVLYAGVHYGVSTKCCCKQEMYSVGGMVLTVMFHAFVHYEGSTKCC